MRLEPLPHFTLQIGAQGPLLTAYIAVSQARLSALAAAKQATPSPAQIRGLVDTGASNTCVDPTVLKGLGLSPTGIATVNTPSTGAQPHTAEQYDVSLIIPGGHATHSPLIIQNVAVICAELLAQQGFHALIGRDVLSQCIFSYNGGMNMFTLGY